MARNTHSFTVDNIGDMEPIVAQTSCNVVTIYEQGQAGTANYRVAAPAASDPKILRPAGSRTIFDYRGKFRSFSLAAGQIIGYIETISGALEFAQEED